MRLDGSWFPGKSSLSFFRHSHRGKIGWTAALRNTVRFPFIGECVRMRYDGMRFRPRAGHGRCCRGVKRSGAARAAPGRSLMLPGCDIIATLAAAAEFFAFSEAGDVIGLWRKCHGQRRLQGARPA